MKVLGGGVIERSDLAGNNGIVHTIGSILIPADASVDQYIQADSRFTFLKRLIAKAGNPNNLFPSQTPFTLLAPTDAAFTKMSMEEQNKLLGSPDEIRSFLRKHIFKGAFYSNILSVNLEYGMRNIDGGIVTVKRPSVDIITFNGDTQIVTKDIMISEGVMHAIDNVLSN